MLIDTRASCFHLAACMSNALAGTRWCSGTGRPRYTRTLVSYDRRFRLATIRVANSTGSTTVR